jgi:hypothetical protein
MLRGGFFCIPVFQPPAFDIDLYPLADIILAVNAGYFISGPQRG